MSFDLILPYLRPIESLLLDDDISEIMVNASGRVFIERLGVLAEVTGIVLLEKHLNIAAKNIARLLDDDISEAKPMLDARLTDGSRVAVMIPPCSVAGTTLTIRKFGRRQFSLDQLVDLGCLNDKVASCLLDATESGKNVLISGGTGTGKTTLLSALLGGVPVQERIVLIEDTAEIQLCKANLVRFEARRASPELPEVSIRDLIKASLRHRPDRIIVGEVRGGEAFDLLQALNTGHAGAVTTVHANSAENALTRLSHCVLQSGVALPYVSILRQVAELIDLVAHIERRQGKRLVTELISVRGFDDRTGRFEIDVLHGGDLELGGSNGSKTGSLPPHRRPVAAEESSGISPLRRSV